MSRAAQHQGNKTAHPSNGDLNHPAKAIYFATGSPELALEDIERLGLAANGTALRVVSPASGCARLRRNPALQKSGIIAYSHGRALWVWLRLLAFLGFTRRTEVICLNTPQNYRLLKLLAFSLRGRGRFSTGQGQTPEVSVLGMIRLSWHNYWIRNEERFRDKPMLVVGSGSARSLRLIAAQLRDRYPGRKLTAWLPSSLEGALSGVFDETVVFAPGLKGSLEAWRQLWSQRLEFKAAVVPCTNEFERWMKLPAVLAPLRKKKIYNELGDSFELSHLGSGLEHLRWRFLRSDRKLTWPVGVIGSASGYYLEKIVASLRRSFPGSEIHGWLSPLQAASAGHLFDVVHPLSATGPSLGTLSDLLARGRRCRGWVIPCTDEPFGWLKLLAFCLPLRSRMLYNETGDGFPLRSAATVWEHIRWRLRYKFTVQFLSGASDSSPLHRLVHVPAYALRLASAAPMLWRATRHKEAEVPATKTIKVLLSGNGSISDVEAALRHLRSDIVAGVKRAASEADILEVLFDAARADTADYICLLDGECRLSDPRWLEHLLEAFDETVAQVGPEMQIDGLADVYQGALFDSRGGVFWNTNSAARFHRREQWLEVAALPGLCLVVRREALLAVAADGRLRARSGRSPADAMSELGRLFAISGWLSICNTKVSALYPLKAREGKLHFSAAT